MPGDRKQPKGGGAGQRQMALIMSLTGVSFFIEFPVSPHAEPLEEIHRRTPTLEGMLKQECRHRGGQEVPTSAYQAPEREADE